MKFKRYLSLAIILAMLLSTAGLAEEMGEVDLYAPEIYDGESAVEAPAAEAEATEAQVEAVDVPMAAEAPAVAEAAPAESAVAEPEPVPAAAVQTVALTDRKASAQMNVEETLQIAVNAGEAGTFTSKSPKLAAVDASGLVTALAKGTAKIEFKPEGGKKRTLSVKILNPYEPAGVSIAQGGAITMNVGDALQLDATLSPETARTTLTWKTARAKVAAVDASGVVTALSEGKAKLTVTTSNRKKATVTVTVLDPYKPAGVSIGQGDAITMNVGDALQLDAALSPETARTVLTWKSAKAKVASVDANGVVTALSEGKAKLTVTTSNRKKATVTVTVVNPYKPSGVSIDMGTALTLTAGEGVQLGAVLTPETARATLTWKSSKPKVAKVDGNGYVTALSKGTAKITVKTDSGKSAALQLQVLGQVEQPRLPYMNIATYNGTEFRVVNTPADPIAYVELVRDKICTSPGLTGKYAGYCLGFCHYYVACMVDGITDVSVAVARKRYMTSRKLRYTTEKYADPNAMMANLYDLLNTGLPQIMMVEAITHPGSRHFVVVIGYRSSVTRREDLRPEDLLIIDSYDGRLESMDPVLEPVDTRVLFTQERRYRIDAVRYR